MSHSLFSPSWSLAWLPVGLAVVVFVIVSLAVLVFIWGAVTTDTPRSQVETERELEWLRHRDLERISLNALPQEKLREMEAQQKADKVSTERLRMAAKWDATHHRRTW